jgi:hypothetical protein
MTRIDVLYVGDATDGPVEEFIPVDSLDQAFRLYGGYIYEQTTISSGSTGYHVSVAPWANQVLPMQAGPLDGSLIPLRLFEFAASGTALSWNAPGQSQRVAFRITAEPGSTSLLKGILAAKRTGQRVFATRLGGTSATAGPSGAFTFTARYAGNRYNGTTIVVSGSVVTVTPAVGTGRATVYRPTSDRDLVDQMRDDVARGWIGCGLSGPFSDTQLTVPTGTYTLAGGADGKMSANGLYQFLQEHDLAGVDVLCPVGIDTVACSGAGVSSWLENEDIYPTLLVAQAPPSGVALSGIVNTFRHVCSVGFQTTYDQGLITERIDDAAPLVAALISGKRFGITLTALPEAPPTPRYDQAALHALAAAGHTAAYRSISKDWALWHAETGNADWHVSTFRALQEIARPIFTVLDSVIGSHITNTDELDRRLAEAFQGVSASKIIDWKLFVQGDTLYAGFRFQPYGEVRVISAQIALGTPQSVSPT